MEVKQQQPVAAQTDADGVDIFKFEIAAKVDIKKEIQEIKDASAHQKRLKEKYPKLDGTPIYLLDEIERLQDEYSEDGCDGYIEVSDECRGKLSLSKYGPWLNLTRLNFPRRKKDAKQAVKEYIIVPLMKDGPFGSWKAYDNDAKPEITTHTPYREKPVIEEEKPTKPMTYQRPNGEIVEVNSVVDRLEEFVAEMMGRSPPSTSPPSIKREDSTSESELSEARSMESIEFDESFSSSANCDTVAPPSGTKSMAAQLNDSPTNPLPATPASSQYTQESASPSPSPGRSRSQKTLSKTRKSCMHCGTVATAAWRNGPASKRNKCQNSSCNKPRDR